MDQRTRKKLRETAWSAIEGRAPVGEGIAAYVKAWQAVMRRHDWGAVLALDFEAENPRVQRWLARCFEDGEIPGRWRGLYLAYARGASDDGEEGVWMHFQGAIFQGDDGDWPTRWDQLRDQDLAERCSTVLSELWQITTGPMMSKPDPALLGSEVAFGVTLLYLALQFTAVLDQIPRAKTLGRASERFVAVGDTCGAWLDYGTLRRQGFAIDRLRARAQDGP
jgi:hypothetical protein